MSYGSRGGAGARQRYGSDRRGQGQSDGRESWRDRDRGSSQNQNQDWGAPAYGRRNNYDRDEDYGGGSSGSYRRGRGRGGGNRYDRRETHRVDFPPEDNSTAGFEDRGGGRGRGRGGHGRPPPGLKGREIGLWYARKSQARKEEEQKLNRPTVSMDRRKEDNIRQLLNNLEELDPSTSQTASPSHTATGHEDEFSKRQKCSQGEHFNEDRFSQSKNTNKDYGSSSHTTFVYQNQNKAMFPEKEEPPDDWEVRDDGEMGEEDDSGSFPVEVVPVSQSGCEDTELDTEPWGGGVVQVLDYSKATGEDSNYNVVADVDTEPTPPSDCPELNQEMLETSHRMMGNPQFTKMFEFRQRLPSYQMKDIIVKTVRENQVLVISGETGCGKTTQVPQFILDDYIEHGVGSQCRLICTQPRRISAISVAERVGAERCDKVNDTRQSSVGYQIRLETKRPRSTGSILFCTTGIVLKFLEGDPELQRATHIIIDEIHERDLQSDFLLIILKDLLARRQDLKVILMSATLNAEMFSEYFNNCPMLNIPGYTFPVKEYLLEDIIEMTNYYNVDNYNSRDSYRPRRSKRETEKDREEQENYQVWLRNLPGKYDMKTIDVLKQFDYSKIDLDLIFHIVQFICTKMEEGAILIFVPGWEEIKKLHEMIQRTSQAKSGSLRVLPLHSLMPTVNQREIFDRPPQGVRKIVIATNIAETSITIDDVVFVIDCGKIKVKDFNPEVNLTSLEPQWVSKANAKQRRGRAGRVQPGHCFHLYTAFRYELCQDYLPPEMLRTRLEELCLQIKLLKLGRIVPFIGKAMQHPSMEAITHAVETLIDLNALDTDENLLPLGYHLARMPVEPHTGKMILFGAMFCCLDPILTVAASLSFKDAFTIPLGKEMEADKARKRLSRGSKSDHIMLINAFSGWEESMHSRNSGNYCWNNFLSESTLRMLKDMKKQLAELLFNTGFIASKNIKDPQSNINSKNNNLIRAVLCAGLYPNVAQVVKVPKPNNKRGGCVRMNLKTDGKVMVHPKSVNSEETFFESKWMVFYYKLKTTQIFVHDCTMVSPYPLLFFGGQIKIKMEEGSELVSVDDWVIFKSSSSTAQLVKDLRKQLDKVLTRKITSPGVTSWDPNTAEGALMAAIADLITTEDAGKGRAGGQGSIGQPASASRRDYDDY